MEKQKLYRHKTATLAVIKVDFKGKVVPIKFKFGTRYPIKVSGFFITNDPKLQKAIEAHGGFNDTFFLEQVNGKMVHKESKDTSVEDALRRELESLKMKYKNLLNDFNQEAAMVEKLKAQLPEAAPDTIKEKVEEVKPEAPKGELKTINVANLQEAKALLKGEPFNVEAKRLPSQVAVINKAEALGINLIIG